MELNLYDATCICVNNHSSTLYPISSHLLVNYQDWVKAFGQENSNLPAIFVILSNNQAIVCCKDFTITVYTFLICIVLTVNIISYFGSLHRHCVIIHMCLAHVVVYVLQRGCYNTLLFIQVTLKAYMLQMRLYAKRIQVLYMHVYLIMFYYLTMYCTCIWPLWSHRSLSQTLWIKLWCGLLLHINSSFF